ncbi:MAG: DUF997 domain-containing protein [Planctomycetota bacterium]|jgi:hypothetical protein
MERKKRKWLHRGFALGFLILTFLCWCPVGYGSIGPVGRIFGIPTWAAVAFALAAGLFVLEWVYLFMTGLAVTDEGLAETVAELEKVDADSAVPAGKDS